MGLLWRKGFCLCTYPVGATLPSETRLIDEFDMSRPTVVRPLEIMRQLGWIEAQHGMGRTVLGKPATGARTLPAHTAALGLRDETAVIARWR